MKSFQQFEDFQRRKYACVNVSAISTSMLREWCRLNGFDTTISYKGNPQKATEFDFHVTLFYTDSYHDTKTGIWRIEPFDLIPIGFEMLGEEQNIPVLLLDPEEPQLAYYRKHFEGMGFTDKWPAFKPHISLSYSKSVSSVEPTLPSFNISANKLKVSNIS